MSQNQGTISYTIGADTSPLLKAEKTLATHQGKVVNALGQISKAYDPVTRKAKAMSTQVTKSAKGVNTALSGMGRNAGMAGIQIQQFVGQIQGGQNAMVALSQQGADLGFVLGAPLVGAIVGIGASVIGMAAAFGKVKVEMKSTSDIAKELVGDFSKLDVEAQKLARGVLVADIRQQEKALKQLKKEQGEYLTSLKLFTSTEEASDKYQEYTANILSLGFALDKSKESLKSLGKDTEDYTGFLNEQQKSIGDLISSTVHLGNTYGFNARELSVYEAELQGANSAQIIALNLAFDTIEAKEAEAESVKKQIAAEKELQAAKKGASSFATGITKRGLSPEQKLQADLDQVIRDKELVDLEVFEAAKTSIEKQQSDLRKKNRDDEAASSAAAQMAMTGAVLGFLSATTSALLAGMDEQSGAYKALFAVQKASQIAMTIANAETASTAALPNVVLSGLIKGLGYASAGVIAGTTIAGARKHGGNVSANGMFRMGEDNKPEVLQTGQGMFAVPGDNGKVFNQSQLDQIGGGQAVNVNVVVENNAPSASVSTQSSDDGRMIKIVINEVANQISRNQGPVPRALRQSTNVTMKANR